MTESYFEQPSAAGRTSRGRARALKVAVGAIYVLVVGATAAWVVLGWPGTADAVLEADATAVPGALEGNTLVLVSNVSDITWTNVQIVLNDELVYSTPSIAPDEQIHVPINEFTYSYAIPRDWNVGIWGGLSTVEQPSLRATRQVTPSTISIRADEGTARIALD